MLVNYMALSEIEYREEMSSSAVSSSGAAGRSIMKPRSNSGGLLARRRSRSRASASTSSSSVTFDLALEIPHESTAGTGVSTISGTAGDAGPYFTWASCTRQVHSIEQDSQLIVRQCFRLALTGASLSVEQADQMAEVLDGGGIRVESNLAVTERCRKCLKVAGAMFAMTAELRSTRQGLAVIRRVKQVSLHSLSRADFERHIKELAKQHKAGDNRAQCGSILLFCIELALTAAQSSDRLAFCQVFNWSSDYFRKTVSAWAVRAGGWENIIQEPSKVVASIAFVLSVLLFGRAILRLIRGC